MTEETVILWRCPICGGTDPDTSQQKRYCGRTRKCASASRTTGLVKMTPMERVAYAPYDLLVDYFTAADWYRRCLEDAQDRKPVRGLAEAKASYIAADVRVRELMGGGG